MTIRENIYFNRLAGDHSMPEWVRSERYEYCEDFYGCYTGEQGHSILARLASVLTALFV